MTWIFDQPQYVALLGIAALLVQGAAWSATGRKELVYAMAAVFSLMVAGLIAERLVVTHQEAVRLKLQEIARDVQSNDLPRLLAHIAASSPQLKDKAQAEIPNYRFTECRVTRVHTVQIDAGPPPRAIVEFNVLASGTFRAAGIEASKTIPRWVKLHMVKEPDGQWRVESYEHAPPQQMLFQQNLSP